LHFDLECGNVYLNKVVAYNIREYVPRDIDYEYWHYLNPLEVEHKEIPFDYTAPLETDLSYDIIKNDTFLKQFVFNESGSAIINIHYFPFWNISINNEKVIPTEFDRLQRPIVSLNTPSTLTVQYQQTVVEKTANTITVLVFFSLLMYVMLCDKRFKNILSKYVPLWRKT